MAEPVKGWSIPYMSTNVPETCTSTPPNGLPLPAHRTKPSMCQALALQRSTKEHKDVNKLIILRFMSYLLRLTFGNTNQPDDWIDAREITRRADASSMLSTNPLYRADGRWL